MQAKRKDVSALCPAHNLGRQLSRTVYLYGQAYTDLFCLHSQAGEVRASSSLGNTNFVLFFIE